MSRATAARAYWLRVQRRAAQFAPEVRVALRAGYAAIERRMTEAQLVRFVQAGQVESYIAQAVADPALRAAFAPLRATLTTGLAGATKYHARDVPARARVLAASFNVLEPQVRDAIATLDTRVMENLTSQVRESLRRAVKVGLEDGVSARVMARRLRDAIPLAPNQVQAIANFRRALERRPGAADPLSYKLRDRRFDGAIARRELSASQIDRLVESYHRRWISFNAETNARTAAVDAMKAGNDLAWTNATAEGGPLEGVALEKTWRTVMDGRERPEHHDMNNETVPFDEPYSNGQTIPGEDDYNCRCVSEISVARP